MNRAEVLAAFNRQVRQGTAPDGTGATFETDAHLVRRLAVPGRGGSGVLWSNLDAANADEVIAAQVKLIAGRGEEFEWKLYSYDEPADFAGRLMAAGFRPEEPESLMIAAIDEITGALASSELPPGIRLERATDEAGVDRLIRVHELVFGSDESELRASLLAQLASAPETTDRPGRGRAGQRGQDRLRRWHGICRAVGRRDAAAVAPSGHLPRPRAVPRGTGRRARL